MALVETSNCKIEKLDSNGLGLSSTSRGRVELPYTLSGEEVRFERHVYRGKENFILKEIVNPSPERASSPCKFFGRCGGCLLQHLSPDSYKSFKLGAINEELKKYELTEIITPKNPKRRRINLVFARKESKLHFGLYRFKTEQIINLDSCLTTSEKISDLICHIRDLLENILENSDFGEVFLLEAENGIDIKIITESKGRFQEIQRRKIKALIGKGGIIKLTYLHNKQMVFTSSIEEPYVEFAGSKVLVEADCFLQATKDSDEILSKQVLDYLGIDKQKKIAELFCGRGTLTIPLLKAGFSVTAFENDKKALLALSVACKDYNIKLNLRDLHYQPLGRELSDFDVIILNPPRTGAFEQMKNILEFDNIKKIIYISCAPRSFARDAEILGKKYNLNQIVAIDQFLWSPHVEIAAEFVKI